MNNLGARGRAWTPVSCAPRMAANPATDARDGHENGARSDSLRRFSPHG
jgi:hypothetical protein